MATADTLQAEFYGPLFGAGLDGDATGTFDLAAGMDNNYGTCSRCIRVFEDSDTGRMFFQQSGTLVIDPASTQLDGTINATLTNVTMIEVTIAPMTYTSTPVPNGACVHVASATIAVAPPVVPAAWTCNPSYYADELCDCGCGVVDLDCADALVGSCESCGTTGSCGVSGTGCLASINPTNNAICTP